MALSLGLEGLQTKEAPKVQDELPSQEDLMFTVALLSTRLYIAKLRDMEKDAHNIKTILDTTKEFSSAENIAFAEKLLGCSLETISEKTGLADKECEANIGSEYVAAHKATQKRMKFVIATALKWFNKAKQHIPECKNTAATAEFKKKSTELVKKLNEAQKALEFKAKPGKDGIESGDWDFYQKAASELYVLSKKYLKVA